MSLAEKPENAPPVVNIATSCCRLNHLRSSRLDAGSRRARATRQMHLARTVLTSSGLYVYSYAATHPTLERYDAAVPNKTIYVSDGDLKVYQRAQELAGGNLSSAIAKALRRYVDVQEGLKEGFDDVVVRVGVGTGRKVRFTGLLVGEWLDSRTKRAEHYRVWRGRRGKFVLHVERQPDY